MHHLYMVSVSHMKVTNRNTRWQGCRVLDVASGLTSRCLLETPKICEDMAINFIKIETGHGSLISSLIVIVS